MPGTIAMGSSEVCWWEAHGRLPCGQMLGSESGTLRCRSHSFATLLGTAVSHLCFYITSLPPAHEAHKTSEPHSKEPLKPQPSQLPSQAWSREVVKGLQAKQAAELTHFVVCCFFSNDFLPMEASAWKRKKVAWV